MIEQERIPKRRVPQKQYARAYLRHADHRDVFFDESYHNAIYVGQSKTPNWRKYKSRIVLSAISYPSGNTNITSMSTIDVNGRMVSCADITASDSNGFRFYSIDKYVMFWDNSSKSSWTFYISKNGYDFVKIPLTLSSVGTISQFCGFNQMGYLFFVTNRGETSDTTGYITLAYARIIEDADGNITLSSVNYSRNDVSLRLHSSLSTVGILRNYYDNKLMFTIVHMRKDSNKSVEGTALVEIVAGESAFELNVIVRKSPSTDWTESNGFSRGTDGYFRYFGVYADYSAQKQYGMYYSSANGTSYGESRVFDWNYYETGSRYLASCTLQYALMSNSYQYGYYKVSHYRNLQSHGGNMIIVKVVNGSHTTITDYPDYLDIPIYTNVCGARTYNGECDYDYVRIGLRTEDNPLPITDRVLNVAIESWSFNRNTNSGFIINNEIDDCYLNKDYLLLKGGSANGGNIHIYINNCEFRPDEKNFAFIVTSNYVEENGKDTLQKDDYCYPLLKPVESEV